MERIETTIEFLMRQALAGDSAAYNSVLMQTIQILRPYLSKRLQNKEEVEDVLQETLISIHKARFTYDGNRPFKPWIFAIAKYRLQDYLRKYYSDKLRSAEDLNAADNILSNNVTESPFDYESISKEIKQLSGNQPKILELIHNEGYTAKETAEQLGMKESAVKVAAHRAYKILRKKLAE